MLNGPRPAGPASADNPDVSTHSGGSTGRRLTLHAGGGITWRSDAAAEWEETRAKARGPLRAIGGRIAEEEEP
jgi:anthranilate/para-aminobenzoate synthase component I